jgi:transposase-like protein
VRSEPHIAEGLTHMFVAGTSTHKVGEVAQTLLQVPRKRGATQIDLIVTDGQDGLLAAVAAWFTATPRQRWQVA